MPEDTYPTPTDTAYNDIDQYIPLLLGAIDAELDRDEVWEVGEEQTARAYIADLVSWIVRLNDWIMPTGLIGYFPMSTLPNGWLACDGSAVSRTTYAKLFAIIGTTYGAGNGSTTFNLPDTQVRAIVGAGSGSGLTTRAIGDKFGAENHILTVGQMPAHSHNIDTSSIPGKTSGTSGTENAFLRGNSLGTNGALTNQLTGTTVSQGLGSAHNNIQPSIALKAAIYAL